MSNSSRQRQRVVSAVLLTCCLLGCNQALATNYYVRKSGNDNRRGTSRQQAFRTINQAASVARQGDRIYVGAGTYVENIDLDGNRSRGRGSGRGGSGGGRAGGGRGGSGRGGSGGGSGGSTNSWTIIYADQTGAYTGDRGKVIVRPRTRTWTLQARGLSSFLVYGVTFQNDTRQRYSYGCNLRELTGITYFYNCQFDQFAYGIRTTAESTLYAYSCQFNGGIYGVYSTRSPNTYLYNSKFAGTRHGLLSYDAENTYALNCSFTDTNPSTGEASRSNGLYVIRSGLTVQNCNFQNSYVGILGRDLTSGTINRCKFRNTESQAVDCDGQKLSMSDCELRDGYYGVTLGDKTGGSSTLKNVTITGMQVGIQAHEGDYDFRNVSVSGCSRGILQRGGNKLLTIKPSDDLRLTDNQYAIKTEHSSNERTARLEVQNLDLRNNQRGISTRYTNVKLEGCQFAGQRHGAYLDQAPSVEVVDCQFDGYAKNPRSCSYGLYARADKIHVQECETRHSQYGLYLYNLGNQSPELKRNLCEKLTHAALYLRGGTWDYNESDKNVFRESPYGVRAERVNWTITGVTTDASCDYPIADYYGVCHVSDTTSTGKHTGFYSYRSSRFRADGLTVNDCGQYGLRVYFSDNVQLNKVFASDNRNGVYVQENNDRYTSITNSEFVSNREYGLYLSSTTLDPSVTANLTARGNRHGIAVRDQSLTATGAMQLAVTKNQYGLTCEQGDLTVADLTLAGNGVGLYVNTGALDVQRANLSASQYGISGNIKGTASVADCQVSGARYGIYLRNNAALDGPVQVTGTTVDKTTSYGIYLRGYRGGATQAWVTDCKIRGGRYGLQASELTLAAQRIVFSDLSGVGFYQTNGQSQLRLCSFQNIPRSWSILAYGDRCDVLQTAIHQGRYGIGLLTAQGTVSNTVINSSDYGIYLNRRDGNYNILHATLANNRYMGVLRYQGNTTLKNSIIESSRYGLYDIGRGGRFQHSHNLVHAPSPYRNTTAGSGEINEPPAFVDSSAGDLRLDMGSPAINAGEDLSALIASDLDGNARPSFRGFEMGAYEYMNPKGSLRVLKWDEVASK